jgi:2-methylisocitrate lyase-like PEP mutase family enzyme
MGGAARLRGILDSGEQVVAPGVYDPLSAKAVISLGFNAVDLGGFASAATIATMEPLMTMTEQVAIARRIVDVIGDTPLIADGHTGYGDPVHVTRAIREFERAGVAAIHIEDQPFPKRASYHRGVKHVVPVREMQERIRSACKARQDDNFMIIARTDARTAVDGSLDEVIDRMRAYVEAGADALMPMPNGREEAERVREAIPDIPMVWVGGLGRRFGDGTELSLDALKGIGYEIVVFGVIGICQAICGITQLYAGLSQTGVIDTSAVDDEYDRIMHLVDAPFFYGVEAASTETYNRT